MLVVHPSSRCDVCLDAYQITKPENSPYAIYCGHIFCKTCLGALAPSTCPLCRKPFALDKVKRLIVDLPPAGDVAATAAARADGPDAEATQFLEQVALVSSEETPFEDALLVVDGVKQWLAVQPDDPNSYRALRAAVDSLHAYKTVQQNHAKLKHEYKQLKHAYKKKQRIVDQDVELAKTVEAGLMADRDEYKAKFEDAEERLAALQHGLTPPSELAKAPRSQRSRSRGPGTQHTKITYAPDSDADSSDEDAGYPRVIPGQPPRHLHAPPVSASVSAPAPNPPSHDARTLESARSASYGDQHAGAPAKHQVPTGPAAGPPAGGSNMKAKAAPRDEPHSRNSSQSSSSAGPSTVASSFTSPGLHMPVAKDSAGAPNDFMGQWLARTGLPGPGEAGPHERKDAGRREVNGSSGSGSGSGGSAGNSEIRPPTNAGALVRRADPSPPLEQPVARAADSAVPAWAQQSAPAPSQSLRRVPTGSSVRREREAQNTDALARVPEEPRRASHTPPDGLPPPGVGSLMLYSVAPESRDTEPPAQRRAGRRPRTGSRSDTEQGGPALRAHQRVQAASLTRENSAPAAGPGPGRALTSMPSVSDLGLLGFGAAPEDGPGAGAGAGRSVPVAIPARERPGARESAGAALERPESSASWGTMATPSPRQHHLSDLGLDELAQVPSPLPGAPGSLDRGALAFGGRTPGLRARALGDDDEEGFRTPRNRTRSETDLAAAAAPSPNRHAPAGDSPGDGGLGLSFARAQPHALGPAPAPTPSATAPRPPQAARPLASGPLPPTSRPAMPHMQTQPVPESARPPAGQRSATHTLPHAPASAPPVPGAGPASASDRPHSHRSFSQSQMPPAHAPVHAPAAPGAAPMAARAMPEAQQRLQAYLQQTQPGMQHPHGVPHPPMPHPQPQAGPPPSFGQDSRPRQSRRNTVTMGAAAPAYGMPAPPGYPAGFVPSYPTPYVTPIIYGNTQMPPMAHTPYAQQPALNNRS